jgi:hypothetical protein
VSEISAGWPGWEELYAFHQKRGVEKKEMEGRRHPGEEGYVGLAG